jgi:outer membrane biosynthesis protein TonB
VNFVYFADKPVRVVATTCFGTFGTGSGSATNGGATRIAPQVTIYDYCPSFGARAAVLATNDPTFYCAHTSYDAHARGTFWVSIEDQGLRAGAFELSIACSDVPTPQPSLAPSQLPSPQPTHGPSPRPTGHPTPEPSPFPTRTPTALPTPGPTLSPTTAPTQEPTPVPTTLDTVGLGVTLTFAADSSANLTEASFLAALTGKMGGADLSNPKTLRHFQMAFTPDRRLLEEEEEEEATAAEKEKEDGGVARARQRRLAAGTVVVTFEVVGSLAALGFTDAGAFEAALSADLAAAIADGSLSTDLSAACGCAVAAEGEALVAASKEFPTLRPTPAPTMEPSLLPTPEPTLGPSPEPTPEPTFVPTNTPSPLPTFSPTPLPAPEPTLAPAPAPTPVPTLQPTPAPTLNPTPVPSLVRKIHNY